MNKITLRRNDDGSFVIIGEGPAWPDGSVWPGYAPERERVARNEAAALAAQFDAEYVEEVGAP